MKSDLVLQDIAPDVTLQCVTEHPGFNPVCLQKWSLLKVGRSEIQDKGKKAV